MSLALKKPQGYAVRAIAPRSTARAAAVVDQDISDIHRVWRTTPGAVAPLDAITAQLDCIVGDSHDRRRSWEAERMSRLHCTTCGTRPAKPGSRLCRGCGEVQRVRMVNRRRLVSAKRRERNRALRHAARRALFAFERGSVVEVESRMGELRKALRLLDAA